MNHVPPTWSSPGFLGTTHRLIYIITAPNLGKKGHTHSDFDTSYLLFLKHYVSFSYSLCCVGVFLPKNLPAHPLTFFVFRHTSHRFILSIYQFLGRRRLLRSVNRISSSPDLSEKLMIITKSRESRIRIS